MTLVLEDALVTIEGGGTGRGEGGRKGMDGGREGMKGRIEGERRKR